MAVNIFNAILVFMHLIYDIYIETRRFLLYVIQYLEDSFCGPRGLKAELDYIQKERAYLEKPLSHLVVILGYEVVSLQDVVRIVLWSQAVGVSYVSFYDHKGQLKKHKSALDETLLTASNVKSHIPRTNGFRNGFARMDFPHIMLLDVSDGKASIVRVTQMLCDKAVAGELEPNKVDPELIHNFIINEVGVPEPELGIYCGDVCSLFGFLPWHARVTEFLPLRSHHNVSVRTFVSLLRRFNKCEQRLGT